MTKPLLPKPMREELRKLLVKHTNCAIQGPKGNWPCGTCFMSWLNLIGLDSNVPEYSEKNKDGGDRHNEVWRAILQIREAKIK